jgi:hypothetical protein
MKGPILQVITFTLIILSIEAAYVQYSDLSIGLNAAPVTQRVGTYIYNQFGSNPAFFVQNAMFYIDWTITNTNLEDGLFQIYLYHDFYAKGLGIKYNGVTQYCCYQDMVNNGANCTVGQIATISNPDLFYENLWTLNFTGQDSIALNDSFLLRTEGVWNLMVIRCSPDESDVAAPMTVTGYTHWVFPYGEIPGSSYGFLPFYFVLAFVYFCLGIYWLSMSAKYRQTLLRMQGIIGVLILIGFTETIFDAFYYFDYNSTGYAPLAFGFFAIVFLRILMRLASYNTMLLLVKGYTIYRPRLRYKEKRNMIILASLYVVFGIAYDTLHLVRDTPPDTFSSTIPAWIEYVVEIPISFFDFCYFFWIFWELFLTVITLHQRRDDARKAMFKTLAKILMVAYIITFIFYTFELIVEIGDYFTFWWKGWWVWDAYYSFGHIAIILVICFIWRPNSHNERYAYNEFTFTNAHQAEIALEPLEIKEVYEGFKVLF